MEDKGLLEQITSDPEFFFEMRKAREKKNLKRVEELLNNYKVSNEILKEILDWYYLEEYYQHKI